MNYEDIIGKIKFGITEIECVYNNTPNKIIIGTEIVAELSKDMLYTCHYHKHRDEPSIRIIFGIPVEIDYSNPQRISVCLEYCVDVN